ncbi:S-methylmethionine-dependent homocysteine/selenocysteine methylase [Mesocricetibacter intestinalis]|uniref:S-methylmethionine-dependent homocysteine/selenocysteine methylase n=1 Tax=Mesocricetibacter intestinalis TaxID=1521930 RepID=A0A4V3D9M7_9PAST|nr:homocysteine S-methyltransferase family protein [Mesocricetibacter intestinalis]TDQ57927.1 S-methylmethionine-dependent homocysteine/selenocysteine methylase [Mesocricetibacter intestinalis]
MAIMILDGGMGRELARRNAPFRQPEWSALALYEDPQAVQSVHEDFIRSGAQLITTNSYALVPFHIGEQRFRADAAALADLAGRLAQNAVRNTESSVKIAASLPPLFGSYRPDLFEPERVREIAQPIIHGLSPYVDLWLCETQSSIIEPLMVKELLGDDRPFWVSFTLEDENPDEVPCLRSGERVQTAVEKMAESGVAAILFNCCQPEVIEQAIKVTKATLEQIGRTDITIGAYANAFPPQSKEATANDGLDEIRRDLDPQAYLNWAQKWIDAGAGMVGGCCGIGPEHIRVLAENLKDTHREASDVE